MKHDDRYTQAVASFGPALQRLVRGLEADADQRRDLLQDIHIELWRSMRVFEEQCSLRTWVYRVAHNVRASCVMRSRRPPDAQVMGLYLEDIGAGEIAEIVGISPGAVATKIHRIKTILARMFQNGGPADGQA